MRLDELEFTDDLTGEIATFRPVHMKPGVRSRESLPAQWIDRQCEPHMSGTTIFHALKCSAVYRVIRDGPTYVGFERADMKAIGIGVGRPSGFGTGDHLRPS